MITGKTFADVYGKLAAKVYVEGSECSPRGMKTKELIQETFCIEDPSCNLAFIEGRNFSIMHAIAESLLLVSKTNSVTSFSFFNEKMKQFSDDGVTLHGAYGYRIADSLWDCLGKLVEDRNTRQAILSIHRVDDVKSESKDIPCTISLQFTIREDKLNLHVYMRSNDLIWGTPYDVFVFTNLQMVFANTLGIGLGKYYHTATSLHVYENMYSTLLMLASGDVKPISHKNGNTLANWQKVANIFTAITHGYIPAYVNMAESSVKDSSYYYAILMEMAYKGILPKEIKEQLKKAVAVGRIEVSWLSMFTKRWWKE